jgi:hypothetical protein
LAAAVYQQRLELVLERQLVCRSDVMQGMQYALGLPAFVDLAFKRLLGPVAFAYLRFQLGVDGRQLPGAAVDAHLKLIA